MAKCEICGKEFKGKYVLNSKGKNVYTDNIGFVKKKDGEKIMRCNKCHKKKGRKDLIPYGSVPPDRERGLKGF